MWPLQHCMDLRCSQRHREWIWEREGFSCAPKFPGCSSKQVSVSKHVPTGAPYSPVPLCSLSSEKGIQLFEVDKYICIVPSHSVCVLSLYKWMCNTAHCNTNKGWHCSATFLSALRAIQTIKLLPLLKMNNCRGFHKCMMDMAANSLAISSRLSFPVWEGCCWKACNDKNVIMSLTWISSYVATQDKEFLPEVRINSCDRLLSWFSFVKLTMLQ